ncbi:15475_t:CDS:2 [Acaulospora colombiana]|uniref:15475_t:CDS:1 n=1 Tax=Acaulospora colombiana TaxID=27376 RepID=A0ACA9MD40_9GLOM|nr:15475_t:CDS:2 [Acaulospora colombiana]
MASFLRLKLLYALLLAAACSAGTYMSIFLTKVLLVSPAEIGILFSVDDLDVDTAIALKEMEPGDVDTAVPSREIELDDDDISLPKYRSYLSSFASIMLQLIGNPQFLFFLFVVLSIAVRHSVPSSNSDIHNRRDTIDPTLIFSLEYLNASGTLLGLSQAMGVSLEINKLIWISREETGSMDGSAHRDGRSVCAGVARRG